MVPISLHEILLGLAVFAALFLLQALLWHFCAVKRQFLVLISLFLIGPAVVFAFGFLGLAGLTLTWLLSANYISTFPVLQASSPTLVILELIYYRRRISEKEIVSELLTFGLIEDRIRDLETGSLVRKTQNGFSLTRTGNFLATLFIVFRRLLSLPQGAG